MTLLQTDFLPTKSETFQSFRALLQMTSLQPGVIGTTDYKVAQRGAGANMSVDVPAGDAWIAGTSVARQGLYHQTNDATVNVAVTAADATNPRIDQVILVVNDSAIAGGSDTPTLVVVAGTPTAGATLANRNGAVSDVTMNATYPNRIRLADLLIPAASSSVTTANILDRRPWARGARHVSSATGGAATCPGGSTTSIPTLTGRMESSGKPLLAMLQFGGTSPVHDIVQPNITMDGVQQGGRDSKSVFNLGTGYIHFNEAVNATAGSRVFSGQIYYSPVGQNFALNAGAQIHLIEQLDPYTNNG